MNMAIDVAQGAEAKKKKDRRKSVIAINESPDLAAAAAALLLQSHDDDLVIHHADIGGDYGNVFIDYEGTKREDASAAKKAQWSRARMQRRHVEIQLRPIYNHQSVRQPTRSLAAGEFEGKGSLHTEIETLPKPVGVSKYIRQLCVCNSCVATRELELKCDRLWVAGQHQEAITLARAKRQRCTHELPLSFNGIRLRSIRHKVPKPANYLNPLQKHLDFGPVYDEKPKLKKTNKSKNSILDETQQKLAEELEEIDKTIRRMRGSADWIAEVTLFVLLVFQSA